MLCSIKNISFASHCCQAHMSISIHCSAVQCSMVWYGMVRYGTGTVWCGMLRYGIVRRGTVPSRQELSMVHTIARPYIIIEANNC